MIDSGTVIVRGGKIVSVSAGAASTQGLKTIDAKGMSAMPGLIDAHRHINTGPDEKAQMQALLEAGYTTILSGGGPADGNLTLRDHIDKGVINGPRIIPSGRVQLRNNTPDMARAEIRKMAEMGVKFTGEIGLTPVPGPTRTRAGRSPCDRGRGEEGRCDGAGPRCELACDGCCRRGWRAARWSTFRTRTGSAGRMRRSWPTRAPRF